MKIVVKKDYESMSKAASEIFIEAIKVKPDITLGLATGSTPKGMYKELIKVHKEEGLDFSKVKTFNLDEYVGLSHDHLSSYGYYMDNEFFNHINVDRRNIFIPDGKAKDVEKHCREYDEMIINAGGIDLLLLGIGVDGHIAFNEPADALSVKARIVRLAQSTIEVNSRFFNSIEEVPKTAITMGMGSILKSKKIVLLANGVNKSHVIKKLLKQDKVTPKLPVSFLLLHPDVTVIVDELAYNG